MTATKLPSDSFFFAFGIFVEEVNLQQMGLFLEEMEVELFQPRHCRARRVPGRRFRFVLFVAQSASQFNSEVGNPVRKYQLS